MRRPVLLAGVVLLGILWLGPLPELARGSFSAHMALHMGVVALAAPLVAIGIARTRLDPVARAPHLWAPIPASIVELMVVWAWHGPALHHWARTSTSGFLLEQSSFLAAGLLLWISALGGEAREEGHRTGAGIIALLLTAMHMTLLGALLALTPRPLYHHAASGGDLVQMADQHLGGAIMILLGGVSYLAGGLWLTTKLLLARDGGRSRQGASRA